VYDAVETAALVVELVSTWSGLVTAGDGELILEQPAAANARRQAIVNNFI
jgi:hypothetical protein